MGCELDSSGSGYRPVAGFREHGFCNNLIGVHNDFNGC
jgi:hypothetical protein